MLPHFQGAEETNASPFLDYPIWKENWNLHIEDYEPKSRSIMLLHHLDKEAKRRIAGKECDYEGAIANQDLQAHCLGPLVSKRVVMPLKTRHRCTCLVK